MENELKKTNYIKANMQNINQGTVAVEMSKAMVEAREKLYLAKQFPRNEVDALQKAINSCASYTMAKSSFYTYPRGGQQVSGASIRFAEELARCWGNIDYGMQELSRDKEKSELCSYCWDLETNTMSKQNFTVPHFREKGGRMERLASDRDIYETTANMGARRMRARILAILPNWYVEACVEECKKTLAGQNDIPLIERVRKMVIEFAKFGVTPELIEKRLKRKCDTMTSDDFVEYVGIFNSLKDGQSKISDWFEYEDKRKTTAIDLVEELEKEE